MASIVTITDTHSHYLQFYHLPAQITQQKGVHVTERLMNVNLERSDVIFSLCKSLVTTPTFSSVQNLPQLVSSSAVGATPGSAAQLTPSPSLSPW